MKIPLEDLECSMDGLECSAVQATKQQYLQLDQNNYHQLELLLGHAILGNFSTNQMAIELTKILK